MGVEYSISNKKRPDECAWWKNNHELAYFIKQRVKLLPTDSEYKFGISREDIFNVITTLLNLYRDSYKAYYQHINDLRNLRDEAGSADILLYDVYGSAYSAVKTFEATTYKIENLDAHWEGDGEVLMSVIQDLIKMLADSSPDDEFIYQDA